MAFVVFCGFLYLAAVNCESSCWQDPSNGRLDCDGRSGCEVTGMACHSECECRHLDTVEQRRFSTNEFRYPSSPALVITASRDGKRCASTWAFNAVRLLFRQAKEACDSYWLRQVTKEKLDQRVKTGTHVVVKTHEWHGGMEAFEKLKHRFTHVILSVREGFPREETWMSVASHVLHFEKLVAFDTLHPDDESKIGALTVLKDLSEHLGLSLTQRDLKEVDYELMTLQIPQSGCNQTTKLWPFHGRRGGRPIPKQP